MKIQSLINHNNLTPEDFEIWLQVVRRTFSWIWAFSEFVDKRDAGIMFGREAHWSRETTPPIKWWFEDWPFPDFPARTRTIFDFALYWWNDVPRGIPVSKEEIRAVLESAIKLDNEYGRCLLTWALARIVSLEQLISGTDDEMLKRQAGLCSCVVAWDKYCPEHGKNSQGES